MGLQNIKYVLRIVLLVLTISFAADKLVFFSLNKISDQVYSGQSIGKLNHYLKIKDSLDFIVFGSSRANHNIDPKHLAQKGFNMGADGIQIAYSVTLAKLLNNKEQTILLHVDPTRVFEKQYDAGDIGTLRTKYNRVEGITKALDSLKKTNILQNFYYSLNYNGLVLGILKNFFKPKYDYKQYSGYDPLYVTEEQKLRFLKSLEKEETTSCQDSLEINRFYNYFLDDLGSFCRKNNKTLIVFSAPVLNDACSNDNIYFSEILRQKGILYYDFTSFFKEDTSLDNWKDKTHLSNIGAEKFTKNLKKILLAESKD